MIKSLTFLSILLVSFSCSKEKLTKNNLIGKEFGTTYQLTWWSDNRENNQKFKEQMALFFKKYNQVFSTYLEDSEVSKFNNFRGKLPYKVSPQFFEMIKKSFQISKLTNGRFDPTVGSLTNPKYRNKSQTEVSSFDLRKKAIGIQNLRFSDGFLVEKANPLTELDFSAMAKGSAIDEIALIADSLGFQHYLLEIGGEVRAKGYSTPFHRPDSVMSEWRIGIEIPVFNSSSVNSASMAKQSVSAERHLGFALALSRGCVATSGNYRQVHHQSKSENLKNENLKVSGLRGHTVNPGSGEFGKEIRRSVSVWAQTCELADAWATALMVDPLCESFDLAEKRGVAAFYQAKSSSMGVWVHFNTSAWKQTFSSKMISIKTGKAEELQVGCRI